MPAKPFPYQDWMTRIQQIRVSIEAIQLIVMLKQDSVKMVTTEDGTPTTLDVQLEAERLRLVRFVFNLADMNPASDRKEPLT